MIDYISLGKSIQKARKSANITQVQLAEYVNVSVNNGPSATDARSFSHTITEK